MKLRYESDWAKDVYWVGKRKLATLTKVRIDNKDYAVTSREVTVCYSDMGHECSARSKHYFVKTKVFGKMMEFDLNSITATITPLKYTLEETDEV